MQADSVCYVRIMVSVWFNINKSRKSTPCIQKVRDNIMAYPLTPDIECADSCSVAKWYRRWCKATK